VIRWLLYLLPAIFATIICYLTNPIVVLFCDEEGELPGLLHMWQTWDDSCDSEFFLKECVPSCLDYGWDEHYTSYTDTDEWSVLYGKTRKFSIARPEAVWTTKQRLQRYICRVLWLYRNSAYGFMFYCFGADLSGATYKLVQDNEFYCRDNKGLFCYKNEKQFCRYLRWKIYLGWKTYPGNDNPRQCMYAYRFWIEVI